MSILVNLLCRGNSQPSDKGFSNWLGRKLALRHKRVTLAPDTRVSPGAMICPRQDAIAIGPGSMICSGAKIQGNIRIGSYSSVQNDTVLVGYGEAGMITIGDYVRIAAHCMIIAGNHRFDDITRPIHEQGIAPAPIVIEDDVWIGGGVSITAGVTIGRGSVIGAGSVVTKDIPPMSVAVGVPARVIRTRS